MENKFIRVFLDYDLRSGHDGLLKSMKTAKMDYDRLNNGDFVCFINKAKTALKLMATGNIVVHLKMPQGETLNLETIQYIPHAFNAEALTIDYKKAKSWVIKARKPVT